MCRRHRHGPGVGRQHVPSSMKEPTCKLVCTGCGLEMPYRDRSLAEQAAELHQLRDDEHVTFIVPPDWSPEEPVTHR